MVLTRMYISLFAVMLESLLMRRVQNRADPVRWDVTHRLVPQNALYAAQGTLAPILVQRIVNPARRAATLHK